jgi:hypothetical protein
MAVGGAGAVAVDDNGEAGLDQSGQAVFEPQPVERLQQTDRRPTIPGVKRGNRLGA